MASPTPKLLPDAPVEVLESRVLFPSKDPELRQAGSLVRLNSGRLLLGFYLSERVEKGNYGDVMLSHSDDNGRTWTDPRLLHRNAGWHCLLMGGLNVVSKNHIRAIVGGLKLDFSLGGDEPFTDTYTRPMDSFDGGETWSGPGPDIKLFPEWTEMYGASNPHTLPDGRLMWVAIGTMGRDVEWHCGVTFTGPDGEEFTPPVIIAHAKDRHYSDTDAVRLDDGRFLAVIREHVTRQAYQSYSDDEGKTWTPIRPTGFKGSNIKLFKLRSGAIFCAYRDEDPARRGVSCSVTEDGGATWRLAGQLYAAAPDARHAPGYVCGYPDMARINDNEIVCILHTYPIPQEGGRVDLHMLRLREVG